MCGSPAVYYHRVSRKRFCGEHLAEYLRGRVESVMRRVGVTGRLVVAVSGGKDSVALLDLLRSSNLNLQLIPLHIDLGLPGGYSETAKLVASKLGCIIVDLRELIGVGVGELARRARRPPCSVCGVVKRFILNAAAIEASASFVALGHTGDDMAAYAVKAFLQQDLESIGKLGPVTPPIEGLAAGRVRPLYEVFEKETLTYVLSRRLPAVMLKCPLRPRSPIEDDIKHVLDWLDYRRPGVKLNLLRNLARRVDDYPKLSTPTARCPVCGLISAGGLCSFCRLTSKALGAPLGATVREKLSSLLGAYAA